MGRSFTDLVGPLLLIALLCLSTATGETAVVELTSDTFDDVVGHEQGVLVEFFAPWCGFCKKLAPDYEQVGEMFQKFSNRAIVAKMDADSHRETAQRFDISGYPTLKWFPAGSMEPEDYEGDRSIEDIVRFINAHAGTNVKVKKPVSSVVQLTDDTFDEVVMDPSKNVFVKFYAPWCHHCKALAPAFEEVAKTFEGEPNCVVADIDASTYRMAAETNKIQGFPTLKFFAKGEEAKAHPIEYNMGRSGEDMVVFLNDKCGTKRLLGGALAEDAGLVEDLTPLVVEFMSDVERRQEIMEETEELVETLEDPQKEDAQYYVKVMTKILAKGDEYAVNEAERLGRMIDGKSLTPAKEGDFAKRIHVLSVFSAS